jgi:hypothetical protein
MTDAQQRYHAYLLRLWVETSAGRPVWRLSLEEPDTGMRRGFASLDQLFVFLTERTSAQGGERTQVLFTRKDNSMTSQASELLPNHQIVMNRFVAACQADERVVAATLYGSYARGTADAYSDLDLGLMISDEAYEEFRAGREAFIRQLGEPLFLEDFGSTVSLFFILADGTEGELSVGRTSQFLHVHSGAYKVLIDKENILAGAVLREAASDPVEQTETLRRLIFWFWHDFSHFITAMGRRQLWWAQGQLEVLRLMCVNLARLRHNFSDAHVSADDYFKVDLALPVEQLAPLQATFCPMEEEALLQAGLVVLRFYQELAPSLARTHDLTYPAALERVMVGRLEALCDLHR